MNKKILIVSIIAISILFLMPNISAIQHNVVKEDMINEKLKEIDLDDIKELLCSGRSDGIKNPLIYWALLIWSSFRFGRSIYLFKISIIQDEGVIVAIDMPLIFFRGIWLFETTYIMINYFNALSEKFELNWNIPYPD